MCCFSLLCIFFGFIFNNEVICFLLYFLVGNSLIILVLIWCIILEWFKCVKCWIIILLFICVNLEFVVGSWINIFFLVKCIVFNLEENLIGYLNDCLNNFVLIFGFFFMSWIFKGLKLRWKICWYIWIIVIN